MCSSGKVSYPSPQHAWGAAADINRRMRSAKRKSNRRRRPPRFINSVYHCADCGLYHVTSLADRAG